MIFKKTIQKLCSAMVVGLSLLAQYNIALAAPEDSKTFSGVVTIPVGVLPNGGEFFVSAEIVDPMGNPTGSSSFEPFVYDDNVSDYNYSLSVTQQQFDDLFGFGENIRIGVFCPQCNGLRNSYYSDTDGSTAFIEQGTLFSGFNAVPGNETFSGVDFALLEGVSISGDFAVPTGLAPSVDGEIYVGVEIVDEFGMTVSQNIYQNWQSDNSVFDTQAVSIPFSVGVPELPSDFSYRLNYQCLNCPEEVLNFAYYNSAGSTSEFSQAELLVDVSSPLNFDVLETVIFSGSLLRPAGIDQSVPFDLNVCVVNSQSQNQICEYISFAQDAPSAPFSVAVGEDEAVSGLWLSYDCFNACPSGVTNIAYYAAAGTTVSSGDAEVLPALGQSGINFVLAEAVVFSANISLPNGILAQEETLVSIFISDENGNSNFAQATIPINQNSALFSVSVPSLSGTFSFEYSCSDCLNILPNAYYDGVGFNPEYQQGTITDLAILEGSTFELLGAVNINGQIELPSGSLGANLFGSLVLSEETGGFQNFFASFEFMDGGSQGAFSFSVPETSTGPYRLSYSCFECTGILGQGYFDGTDFAVGFGQSMDIQDVSQIDGVALTLIAGVDISGTIGLPDNGVATEDLFPNFEVIDSAGNFVASSSVYIPAGNNAESFAITLPDGDTPLFYAYSCFGCTQVSEQGFWNGSAFAQNQVDQVAVTDPSVFQGQALTMLEPFKLSLTLQRPVGLATDDALNVQLELSDPFIGVFQVDGVIPSGESFVELEFESSVPRYAFGGYTLRYNCQNCPGVFQQGTYNGADFSGGSNASFTVFDLNDIDNNVLSMVPSVQVNGSVLLPGGATANVETTVSILAYSNSGVFTADAIIPAQGSGASFTLDLLSTSDVYTIEYLCFGCDGVFQNGYYSSQGTTPNFADQEQVTDIITALSVPIELIPTFNIQGNLALPAGFDTDQNLDVSVNVYGLDDAGNSTVFIGSVFITLEAGSSDVSFDIIAPSGTANGFRLEYYCESCPAGIFSSGIFQNAGTSLGNQLSPVTESELENGVEFTLLETAEVSGTIALPASLTSELETEVFVSAILRDANGDFLQTISDFIVLPSSEDSQEPQAFSLDVPVIAGASINLEYYCTSCDEFISPLAFYNSAGTVEDELQAETLAYDLGLTGIEFNLLESAVISGVLVRPVGSVNDQELNIQLAVRSFDKSEGFARSIFFSIPAGVDELAYQIPVPRESNLFLSYFCFECDDIWRVGHYSESGTTVAYGQRGLLASGQDGLDDIDIEMVRSLSITGSLNRHATDTNTLEVLPNVLIDVVDGAGQLDADFVLFGFGQQLVIAENESSTPFSVNVPEISSGGYVLRYECQVGCGENTFNAGFYVGQNQLATLALENATSLTPADDLQNLDFSMAVGTTIFGSLSRPAGADDSIYLYPVLSAKSLNNGTVIASYPTFSPLSLPALETSAAYSITLPVEVDTSYRVEYDCVNCPDVYPVGFYNELGTAFSLSDAQMLEAVDVANSILVDADVELLGSTVIGGELTRASLTSNEQALVASLRVTALDANGNSTGDTFPSDPRMPNLDLSAGLTNGIPALSDSIAYSMTIPTKVSELGFRVNYVCDDCDLVADTGFYNSLGTAPIVDDAEAVTSNGSIDILALNLNMLDDGDNDEIANIGDNCIDNANADQANFDDDAFGDLCDDDIDGDNAINDLDSDDANPMICSDNDADQCNDCSSGVFNLADDGLDTDSNGICNVGDDDDDGDLTVDSLDCAQLDLTRFQLISGFVDADFDNVGTGASQQICSGLVLPNGFAPLLTGDNCPSSPNSDQANFDGDADGDVCDSDADNDLSVSADDSDDLNPQVCSDVDSDQCDDCSKGMFNPANDGADRDSDGLCNIGDSDDDGDGVDDSVDNCPLNPNADQKDSDGDGVGDICGELCIPIKTTNGPVVLICL